LEAGERLAFTDVGGVQEETCILGVLWLMLGVNTVRPETVEMQANLLVGASYEKIINDTRRMLKIDSEWENPFGDRVLGNNILKFVDS